MDWFWHVLIVCAIVVPVALMWIAIVIELFRRHDISGAARAGWLVLLFVLPLIGSVLYVIVTWWRAGRDREVGNVPTPGDDDVAEGNSRVLDGGSGRHAAEGIGS